MPWMGAEFARVFSYESFPFRKTGEDYLNDLSFFGTLRVYL
jgi:hypothetical protein